MVVRYYGIEVDPSWLRQILEATPIGTPGFKLRNLAAYGYQVDYAPATDERVLVDALEAGVPPIVLIRTDNLTYWSTNTAHAVVVIGLDDETVTVNDPAFAAPQRIAYHEFMLAWSDFDYLYSLIQPR
jgi:ABC-type bacteriocin/lantibiotic exporter with double-glycine peptidase domain